MSKFSDNWTSGGKAFEAFTKSIEAAKMSMIDLDPSESSSVSEGAEYNKSWLHDQLYHFSPQGRDGRAAGTCSVCAIRHNKLWWDGEKIISECCGQKMFVNVLVEDNGREE